MKLSLKWKSCTDNYSAYSTKEELLESLVNRFFEYVFLNEMLTNRIHENYWMERGLDGSLLKLLLRAYDCSVIVKSLPAGERRGIYLNRLADTLTGIFNHFIDPDDLIPYDFRLNRAVKSFTTRASVAQRVRRSGLRISLTQTLSVIKIDNKGTGPIGRRIYEACYR